MAWSKCVWLIPSTFPRLKGKLSAMSISDLSFLFLYSLVVYNVCSWLRLDNCFRCGNILSVGGKNIVNTCQDLSRRSCKKENKSLPGAQCSYKPWDVALSKKRVWKIKKKRVECFKLNTLTNAKPLQETPSTCQNINTENQKNVFMCMFFLEIK